MSPNGRQSKKQCTRSSWLEGKDKGLVMSGAVGSYLAYWKDRGKRASLKSRRAKNMVDMNCSGGRGGRDIAQLLFMGFTYLNKISNSTPPVDSSWVSGGMEEGSEPLDP